MKSYDILIKKGVPNEITMGDIDDILMDIREFIFNQLNEKEVSLISISINFAYFDNMVKEM